MISATHQQAPPAAPSLIVRGARLAKQYPFVALTLLVGIVTALLLATPWSPFAPVLATCFTVFMAARAAVSMLRSLRSGSWGIDVLAISAIASTVALGDYWAALVVVFMLTGGEALEHFAEHRARAELRSLMSRAPQLVHRELNGAVVDAGVDEVQPGDTLEVRPGEAVPVDSTVLSEGAVFDESSISGESMPIWRAPGSTVLSGAVNGGSLTRMRAIATAKDSQFQTIIELVRRAADSKAPMVRTADRVAVPFTIAAFAIGIAAWVVSGDPARLGEVLVVATPCPLLIATPVALIAAMSKAASFGIVVKSGGVLEQLARIRTVAFDKTGTVTRGIPRVDRIEPADGHADEEVLSVGASLESHSAHVLASAIVEEAIRREVARIAVTSVQEQTALGIDGEMAGMRVAVGKLEFVAGEPAGEWPPLVAGEMAVYVSRADRVLGRIVLADQVRSEAAETISGLRELGITQLAMLSGDSPETAERIASAVGIGQVHAGLMPADKVARMAQLTPRPALMVGDGINDAPVLAAADVGMAMGARGATAASESADVVVLIDDLRRVPVVIRLARRTLRIAYQSIGVGIGISVALMLVASTGVIPAILGATAQEVVDVIAILNSLRAGRAAAGDPVART